MAGNSRKVCQKKDKSKKLTKKFDNIEEAVCNKQGNTIFSFVFDQNLCNLLSQLIVHYANLSWFMGNWFFGPVLEVELVVM